MNNSIAIITMHRVLNYGSILQTIALSDFLKNNGYRPIVVDYLFPNKYHNSVASKRRRAAEPRQSRLMAHLNGLCQRIIQTNQIKQSEGFSDFLNRNLTLSRPYHNESELREQPVCADIYLTGSDQVWNPMYIGQDLAFYLSWVPDSPKSVKISYGSSFGQKNFNKQYIKHISKWLKKYDFISVREENEILSKLGIDEKIVLDPTFLLSKIAWRKFIAKEPIISGKYILCYLIGYSFNPFPYADHVIKKVKKVTGYKVVMISGEPINILRGYKVLNDCTPDEYLNLFYHASYVITSSFHGTAFAINFGIPYTSIVDDMTDNDNRQASLVNQVGLGRQGILRKNTDLNNFSPMKPNCSIAPLLEERRNSSQKFLLNSLKNNNN